MNRIVVLSLIFIFSCEIINSPEINIISESDFVEIQDSDYTLIDVRTQDEFDLGHIDSAINLDFCRTNNRSSKTATILKENGFKDILVIRGGITEWVKNGNDINYTTSTD